MKQIYFFIFALLLSTATIETAQVGAQSDRPTQQSNPSLGFKRGERVVAFGIRCVHSGGVIKVDKAQKVVKFASGFYPLTRRKGETLDPWLEGWELTVKIEQPDGQIIEEQIQVFNAGSVFLFRGRIFSLRDDARNILRELTSLGVGGKGYCT